MMQTGPSGVLGAAGASGETPSQSQGECGGQEASAGGNTEAVG